MVPTLPTGVKHTAFGLPVNAVRQPWTCGGQGRSTVDGLRSGRAAPSGPKLGRRKVAYGSPPENSRRASRKICDPRAATMTSSDSFLPLA